MNPLIVNNSRGSQSKKISLKAFVLIGIMLSAWGSQAQITNYRFSVGSTTPVDITGQGTLIGAGSAIGAAGTTTAIGFNFRYLGTVASHYSVNAAGLFRFGYSASAVAATTESANNITTTTNTVKLMPWWDATATGSAASNGGVFSQLSGTAPNRVLTVQWNVAYTVGNPTGTRFQLKLYETTNVIEFVYIQNPGVAVSSTIGLGGFTSTEYLNIYTTANGPVPTTANADGTNVNTVLPGNNVVYNFTPIENEVNACSTNPLGQGMAPALWLKADAPSNVTRTYLNVPGTSRTSNVSDANSWAANFTAANSVMTTTTGWLANAANGGNTIKPTGAYLQLDLGSVRTIDGLIVAGCSTCSPAGFVLDYSVQVSSDGTTWSSAGTYQGLADAVTGRNNDFPAPVTCRYVRIYPGAFSTYRVIRTDAYTKTTTSYSDNAKVSFWEDQGYNNNNGVQGTAANQMTYRTNQINGNPALVSANASNTWLDIPDQRNLRTTFWVVQDRTTSGTNYFHVLYGGASTPFYHSGTTGDLQYSAVMTDAQVNWWKDGVDGTVATKYDFGTSGKPNIATSYANAAATPIGAQTISFQTGNTRSWEGLIAEILSYNHQLGSSDIQKIETYLAVKYGIELGHDYILADGTVLWNRTTNAAYDFNIFGIGRSDCQGLHQRQSFSVNPAGRFLTIGNNSIIGATNSSATGNDIATNNAYLMVGDNNGALNFDYSLNLSQTYFYLGRRWKVEQTGISGQVKIRIPAFGNSNVNQLPDLSKISSSVVADSKLYLAIDPNGDGNWSDATYTEATLSGTGTSAVYEVNAALPDGAIFTVAMRKNLTDSDSDNVADLYDIDDDNDGIPDTTENPASGTFSVYTFNRTSDAAVAQNVPVRISGSFNTDLVLDQRTAGTYNYNFTNWKLLASNVYLSSDNKISISMLPEKTTIVGSYVFADAMLITNGVNTWVIDDSQSGFTLVGTWTNQTSASYQGNMRFTSTYTGRTATWTFTLPQVTTDTDSDGQRNALDLDSDGDGCSDALEAGATGITTADYKFSGTDANANGLVDAVESGTTGTVKYASTYSEFAVSSTYNACSDSDSDAVGDLFDIDDDNDGIPDLREGCVTASPQADMRTYTWSGGDGDMTVTASTSTNLTFTGLANAWRTRLTEETFSLPLEMVVEPYSSSANIMFGFAPEGAAPVDNNWNGTAYGFFLDGSLNGNARYDATYVGGWAGVTGKKVRLLITAAGVFTVELDGAVLYRQTGLPNTKYRLYTAAYANNSTLSNVKFYPPSAIQSCPLDTDGDGVANRLDLDSDGDGCSDALESGATTDVTANFKFTSNFGANGLANALETVADNGVLNYTANYDAYALSRQFSICKNADSDAVRDHLDVDMDNDGVVNAAEAPQCYYTASDFLYGDRDSFIKVTSGLALGFSYPFLNKLVDGDNGTSTTSYAVRFTATTAAGVPMYSFDMGVPVQLASIYLGFASTTPHNDNNTILTLQGSFDNNTWTSLNAGTGYGSATGQTAVPGVTGAVNAQLFSVTQNAARYRYYRIFWTSGGGMNGNGNATEVYFVTAADHQSSLHPKASCTTDIDGDGLLNTVDLDSDGDGCSDARESSATTSNTANYVFSGTDANGNGLVDAVESGTTGNVNYTLTYQWAMYSSVSGCTDTDGDVSADLRDLDDDNDGVPDAVESPACFNTANQARFINKISSSLTSPDDNQADGNIQVLTDLAFNTYTFNWDAGQQLMGAELFRMEMVTYVNVPNVAIFSNTSFGAGTRAKLQGSRDGTNWLDLTTTDTDLNTTVNKSFPVGQNAGEYLFYRIIGTTTGLTVTTTTIGEVSLGIPVNFNSSASPNIFSTCTTDLDGDGKLNHQDLNADDDGCNDAFEAGATTLKTADYVFSGPFGANGLADALETSAESGAVNYTSTFTDYGLNANIDYCIDTDNDGITDVNDIDDDNDAVPDFEEQGNCTFPSISPSSLTFSGNATLTITSTSIKADYPPGTSWVSSYSTQSFKLPLHLEWTASTTGNGMIGLIPVAATKTISNWTDGAYKVYHNAGSILGYMPIAWNFNLPYTANQKMEIDINENGVVTVKQAGVLIHRFQGAVSKYNVAVSANTSKTFENIKFTAWSTLATCVELDTDGDGLVNRRDLDSDGDGCNDAVEAGAAITTTAIPFTGTVGTNGYVDAKESPAESGEPTYSSTYSFYGLARTKNACADTDNDGVGDLTDVDLENDGVPDYVEANCTNPLFVNRVSNATTKTISGVVLKEADSIAYKVLMSGPAVSYTATNFDGANGIHFLVNDGSKFVIDLTLQLNAYAGENSPTSVAPAVRYVEFGPGVPFNSVAAGTTSEPKNIVLNWPGAYGVVYDPANQLSTHNTGDKIYNGDMLVQNGTLAFGNATTDPKWKVRLYMTTDATSYEIKANIFGDNALANEGFGFNINACSVYDDDADGVYNELDTDSDGDGCSDAYEGGAVNTPGTTTVTGTAGTNGLISTLETDDSFDALINYNSTYYLARSASLNLCADTDGDGVTDLTDIDDDNDGILDTEETSCGQAFFTLPTLSSSPNLQTLTGSLSKGNAEADLEINLIGVATTISTATGFDNSKGGLHYTLTDNDNVYGQTYNITPGNSTIIKQVNWGVNVTSNLLNTTAAIEAQTITLVWNPEVKARIYDPADQLTTLVTGDFIKSGSSITTRANYTVAASTWRIEFLTDGQTKSFFLQVDHKTGSTANIDSWGIYADLCYEADQDGDDLASRLDTDSEDDGCSDAFEAGAAATPGGSAQTLSGPFGANGLANSIETNDSPTAAITYAATTFQAYSAVSACGDTDQDGVPDREDIDDDNDGILDTDEYECATGLFVRSYVIPTGTGIGFGGSYNNGNNRGTGTITFTNLSSLTTVTDQTSAANFKVNDANTNYSIRAALAPTNGIISAFSFGPNLPGNSANAAIVNGQQSITVTWNYPIGGYVFDPDDQLSSHVDGQGINPGDVIVTRAAYSVATSTWKMAIPLNFLSTDVVFQATFQGTANFGDESFGVGLDICNRLTDSDKDKKSNAVDTDSDGDGCFDAVEVQHFKNESLTSEFVAGPYGANGMTSQLENNDTQLATTSYTRSSNYANALIRGCADLDGDNISDNFDIDDDNDGITDQSECPVDPPITSYTLVKADATGNVINMVANTGAIIGKITARSVKNCTVKDMAPNNADKSVNGFLVDGANANTVDRVAELVIEPVSSAFLKIKILINEGGNGPWLFHPRNLRIDGGIAGRGVIKGIPQPSYLKEKYKVGDTIRNTDRISTNFTQPLGASTNKVFIQVQYEATATVAQPLVIRYTWNAIAGTFANENWGFQLLELTPTSATGACDTDGDKISDDRDFDSDNDGCPDVREAGHQEPFTTSVFGDPVITGVFGVNGLSSLVETNDTFSAAMNYSVEVSENNKKDYINPAYRLACDAVTATDDSNTTTEETAVSGNVLPNDTYIGVNKTLTITKFLVQNVRYNPGQTATIPNVGTITISAAGAYTFTPVTNYNGTVPVITYTVSEGRLSDFGDLNITVTPVNDPPVATDNSNTTNEDTPVTGTSVLSDDTDPDNDQLAITQFVVDNTTYLAGETATITGVGTLKINADGTYTFTPALNYNGAVPVATYTVSDGNGGAATAKLTLTITPVNDNPVAVDDSKTTAEDVAVSGTVLANDTDVDGDVLSVTGFTVGGNTFTAGQTATITGKGTIKINADGTYTFTPAADFNGTVPAIPYTISDGVGGTATADLNITVTPVNDNPVAVNDTNTTPEDTPLNGTVIANDTDSDGDALSVTSFSVSNQNFTAGQTATISGVGTIKLNADGTYTFTPNQDYNGTAPTVAYSISDGKGGTATANLVITVTPVNDNPVALDDAKTTAEETAATGTVLTNDSDVDGDALTVTGFTVDGTTLNAGQTGTITGKGTIKINADGTYTFTPAADFNGTVPAIPYTISDGNGGTATANLNITVTPVNDNPVAVNDTNTTPEDTPVSGTVLTNDSDIDGDALSVTGFAVSGQNFTAGQTATISGVGTIKVNADGTYTFTPSQDYNGTVPTVTYTISDGKGGTATANLVITVTPVNDNPVAIDDAKTTTEDTAVSGSVLTNDSDVDGDALTVTGFTVGGTTITAGQTATITGKGTVTINADGTYTFTPAANFNGTVPAIPYTISDGQGGTATANLNITVTSDNDAPVAVNDTNTTAEDTPVNGNVLTNDTDTDGDVLSVTGFSVSGQNFTAAQTATISGVGTIQVNVDGTYTFTPDPDYNGTVPTVAYTISDGNGGTATANLDITVTPVNDSPVAIDDANTTSEETAVSGTVLTNDSDVDGDALTVTGFTVGGSTITAGQTGTIAGKGTIKINADGTYTFTPAADFNGTVPAIPYTISDGKGGTATANLNITVTPVNDNPVAVNDTNTTVEDTPVSGDVITNDTDVDGDALSVTGFSAGGQNYTAGQTGTISGVGTIQINADGTYTFSPALNFNGNVPAVTYTISDGKGGTATATLSITVTPDNDAPVANDDYNTTLEDTPLNGDVLSNDSDLEGDVLSVTGFLVNSQTYAADATVTLNGVGTIVLRTNGTYTFTPVANFNGTVPAVTYSISDGSGGTASAKLYITVTPDNDSPAAVDDSRTTPEDTPFTSNVLTNDNDPEGDALSLIWFQVNGLTYKAGETATISGVGTIQMDTNGSFTFTPLLNYYGTVPTINYTISDPTGSTSSANVLITVTPVNDPPVADNDTNDTPEDTPVSGTLFNNDRDIDGDTFTVTGVSLDGITFVAPGTSLTVTGGNITIDADGTYTFTPSANFNGTVSPIYYEISDPGNLTSNAARLDILVGPENDPPVAVDDVKTTLEDVAVSGNVITDLNASNLKDSDPDLDPLVVLDFTVDGKTYAAGSTAPLPGIGTLVINSDGSYTFTPALDFTGAVPVITYTIADNDLDGTDGVDTATLTITITPVNDGPKAIKDLNNTPEDTPVSDNVLANDSDVDGDVITVTGFSVSGQSYAAGQTATITGVGTLKINADGSYTFTPDTNYNGQIPQVTYTITDGVLSDNATLDIYVTPVNDAPVAVADTKTVQEDNTATGNVLTNDTDAEGGFLTVTQFVIDGQTYTSGQTATLNGIGTLIINSDGSYTFIPVLNYNGNVPVATYTVSDADGATATATLTITVTPVNDPPVANDDSGVVTEDTPLSGDVLLNDSDLDGVALSVSDFTVDGQTYTAGQTATIAGVGTLVINSDGSWTFTPAANYTGAIPSADYTLSDGAGGTDVGKLSLTITPVNDAPVAVNDTQTILEDATATGNVLTNDTDVESNTLSVTGFTISGQSYTAGQTATLNGVGTLVINSNGTYTFTPVANYNGTAPVATYSISDGNGGTASATLTITVTPVNDPPVANDDSGVVTEDTPLSGDVLLNDSDLDGIALSVTDFTVGGQTYTAGQTATIAGVGTLVINSDGSWTFSPDANYTGSIPSVDYTLSDGAGGTDIGKLSLTITPVNDAPVAVNDAQTILEDATATGNVLTNDTDVESNTLTVTGFTINGQSYNAGQTATLNGVGTLVINSDGTYTFTPVANYNGTAPVATYSISDGNGGTASATLTITVTPVNDPPVANDDSGVVTEDTPLSGDVLLNDSDLDGISLSVTDFTVDGQTYTAGQTATIAGVGTLVINSDGSWTFTPDTNYTGSIPSADYTLSDGAGGTDIGQLGLIVTPVNDAPVATNDSQTVAEDVTATGNVLTNDTDVESNTLSVTGFTINGQSFTAGQTATLNGVGTLVINSDGAYTFTPELNYNGSVPVATYSISDGNGGTASATLTITVTPGNDPPVAGDESKVLDVNETVSGDLFPNDSDLDGDTFNVSGFTVAGLTGVFTPGTPLTIAGVGVLTINTNGSWTFVPATGYAGDIPVVTYTIDDGNGGTDTATLTLDITVRDGDGDGIPDYIERGPNYNSPIDTDGDGTPDYLDSDSDGDGIPDSIEDNSCSGNSTCTPTDTDNDGTPDYLDADSDGDGIPDEQEKGADGDNPVDTDGDGTPDYLDADSDGDGIPDSIEDNGCTGTSPCTPNDTDNDGTPDYLDADSDGDGIPDEQEKGADGNNPVDTDGDGTPDYLDADSDGDGLPDSIEDNSCAGTSPCTPTDTDGDGTPNYLDADSDGDGIPDSLEDSSCTGTSSCTPTDSDNDGTPDYLDADSDGDGIPDKQEKGADGNNPVDTDNDGTPDYLDADSDGDGIPDSIEDKSCTGTSPCTPTDTDNDGTPDYLDADSDGDGIPDSIEDKSCSGTSPCTPTDTDNDSTPDYLDADSDGDGIPDEQEKGADGNNPVDTDGDGTPDYLDADSDGDGIPDSIEDKSCTGTSPCTPTDTDGDATPDYLDADSDGDGIPDSIEDKSCTGTSACTPTDTDVDGTPDYLDADSDGDGITDQAEKGADGNNPVDTDNDSTPDYLDADSDGDAIPDSIEDKSCTGTAPCTPTDTDGDGTPDFQDVDSDDDGIPDQQEKGTDGNSPVDTDNDGTPDYLDADSDGDGMPDSIEDNSCAGTSPCTPTDTDGDGTPDYLDADSDGDGITDQVEKGADGNNPADTDNDGTPDYQDSDSDEDGIPDSIEDNSCTGTSPCTPTDTDGDGTPDYRDLDSDGDGIPDSVEDNGCTGTAPCTPTDSDGDGTPDFQEADSDGDGIPDETEKGADGNNPVDTDNDGTPDYLDTDSDGDGISDSIEDNACNGVTPCTPTDTDGDGTPDFQDLDSDGDGITDAVEKGADGTNPVDSDNDGTPDYLDADSDGDGIPDNIEDKSCSGTNPCTPTDTDNDGTPDYLDQDSDADGITDEVEKGADGTNPVDTDSDGTPDYLDSDSDGDGIPDYLEDKACAGTSPCTPTDSDNDGTPDFRDLDSDGDGITDEVEKGVDGSNPVDTDNDGTPDYLDADSDGDGIPDSTEDAACSGTNPCTPTDTDGDGTPDYRDLDSDGDGIPDSIEDNSCTGTAACTPTDTDGDGSPDYLDLDSDGDGIPDETEKGDDGNNPVDTDNDGTPDYLDTDSDGDGIPDSVEDRDCTGVVPCTPTDSDNDGTPDYLDTDSDGDGITDEVEKGADGTNPVDTDSDGTPDYLDTDSDGDGIPDSIEDNACTGVAPCVPTDTDGDGTPDYLDPDSDGDGLPDESEKGADGNNPVDTDNDGKPDFQDIDSDGDGITDEVEKGADGNNPVDTDSDGTPDYQDLDSDDDGIPDSIEDKSCNGTSPCTPTDTDADGKPDYLDLDSDDDGIPDELEKGANGSNPADTDSDGVLDYLDTDSDNDGVLDSLEDGGCTGTAPCTPTDTDNDGIPNHLDPDSDNDGCSDANEAYGDANASGTDGNAYYGNGNPPSVNSDGTVTGATYGVASTDYERATTAATASTITTQPTDQLGVVGTSETFTAVVTEGTGAATTYQWQYSTNGVTFQDITDAAVYTGFNTPVLTISSVALIMQGYSFRLIVAQPLYICAGDTSAVVKLTVNSNPAGVDDAGTVSIVDPTSGSVLTNDSDADSDPLVVTQFGINGTTYQAGQTATIPGIGTIVINANGSYTFTPVQFFTGNIPVITYTVSDGKGGTDTADLVLTPDPLLFIEANDDNFRSKVVNAATGGTAGNIFINDSVNSGPVVPSVVTVEITDNDGLTGVRIEAGNVIIPPNAKPGIYTLTYSLCQVGLPTNCDTATITVEVGEFGILVPEGISPDGDGLNDKWVIRGIENYPKHELTLYNRWGNLIIRRKPYNNDWDGKSDNALTINADERVPAGTYFWVLELGNGKRLTGFVYLAY